MVEARDKVAGAIRGLERLKADFKMRGTNATTIERAIDMLRTLSALLEANTARITELEAALSAATAERERAERAASNVTSETFRYYLAEAENGLCRIPRRVGDDMWFSYMRIVAAREAAEAKAARLKEAITYGAQLDLPAMLEWTADRLVHVHGDSPNVDFVLTLRDRAKRLRAALEA